MAYIDSSFYGAVGSIQPTGTASAQPNPGGTAPVRTEPRHGQGGLWSSPAFWLVALVAIAGGLIHLSIRYN